MKKIQLSAENIKDSREVIGFMQVNSWPTGLVQPCYSQLFQETIIFACPSIPASKIPNPASCAIYTPEMVRDILSNEFLKSSHSSIHRFLKTLSRFVNRTSALNFEPDEIETMGAKNER